MSETQSDADPHIQEESHKAESISPELSLTMMQIAQSEAKVPFAESLVVLKSPSGLPLSPRQIQFDEFSLVVNRNQRVPSEPDSATQQVFELRRKVDGNEPEQDMAFGVPVVEAKIDAGLREPAEGEMPAGLLARGNVDIQYRPTVTPSVPVVSSIMDSASEQSIPVDVPVGRNANGVSSDPDVSRPPITTVHVEIELAENQTAVELLFVDVQSDGPNFGPDLLERLHEFDYVSLSLDRDDPAVGHYVGDANFEDEQRALESDRVMVVRVESY